MGGATPPADDAGGGTGSSGVLALKRCRLSASPATGLVGLKENAFLNDYFGCLGFLPLASESTIRQAMVNIMMGNVPQSHQRSAQAESETDIEIGAEERWSGALTSIGTANDPSKCIMWCAVALGALVKGSPVKYVEGYVQLARDSLMDCFLAGTVETARAYFVMSFLHRMLGDADKNLKYLSFALSIVARLPVKEVPKEMDSILLTADNARFYDWSGSVKAHRVDDLESYCQDVADAPFPEEVVHQRDLCRVVLVADRRITDAFYKDMCHQGAFTNCGRLESRLERELKMLGAWKVRQEKAREEEAREKETSEMRAYEPGNGLIGHAIPDCEVATDRTDVYGSEKSSAELEKSGKEDDREDEAGMDKWIHARIPEPPAAGQDMKSLVAEVMPVMMRISLVAEGSNACSGVGGLFYNGSLAYMRAVQGDIRGALESINRCADVMARYPGVCRFRPHVIHCVLISSAEVSSRENYERMRALYNSVRPVGCKPAPPLEEWTGADCICEHVLCRSVQVEIRSFRHKSVAELPATCVEQGATSTATPVVSSGAGSSCSSDGDSTQPNSQQQPPLSAPPIAELGPSSHPTPPLSAGGVGRADGAEVAQSPASSRRVPSCSPCPGASPSVSSATQTHRVAAVSGAASRWEGGGIDLPVSGMAHGGERIDAHISGFTAGPEACRSQPLHRVKSTEGVPLGVEVGAGGGAIGAGTGSYTSILELGLFGEEGGQDVTDADLMDAAEILLGDGLLSEESGFDNAGFL